MIKEINIAGFNRAVINKVFDNGDILFTGQLIETVDEIETIIKEDSNLIAKKGEIVLTTNELKEFFPDYTDEQGVTHSTIPDFNIDTPELPKSISERVEEIEQVTEEIIVALNEKQIL